MSMLNKVLKKLKDDQKISGPISNTPNSKYPTSQKRGNTGFRAKEKSEEGALRQRSIGNRLNKPSR